MPPATPRHCILRYRKILLEDDTIENFSLIHIYLLSFQPSKIVGMEKIPELDWKKIVKKHNNML